MARITDKGVWCPKCKEYKTLQDFSKNRTRKNGIASQCKACQMYPGKNEKNAVTMMARYHHRGQIIDDLKVMVGCADCQYNAHPEALDFDHVFGDPKKKNVSQLKCFSWKVIWNEVMKCEVVCANCHRIRTANRRKENV